MIDDSPASLKVRADFLHRNLLVRGFILHYDPLVRVEYMDTLQET